MKQIAFVFILTTLLLGSCAPATDSPTPPVVDPVTPTTIPSQTPPPTPSAIPSATPYPPLHTQGPYLLFTRDNKFLTIMDADGSGRKQIQLPGDGYVGYPFEKAISPNGKWIAYFTGSGDEPYDLALNLFNVENGKTFLITNLISPEYPENLKFVEVSKSVLSDDACSDNIICRISVVQIGFDLSLQTLDWSPDSQFLAFASQIDGPSSDLYIYSIHEQKIRRLTDDLQNISLIDWSPKGNHILYINAIPGNIYTSTYIYITDPLGNSIRSQKPIDGGTFWYGEGWIDENSYLIWDGGEGAPPHNFRIINVENQRVQELWRYESELFSFIPDLQGMVFVLYESQIDEYKIPLESGMYFVPANGKHVRVSEKIYLPLHIQDSFEDSFLVKESNDLYSIKADEVGMELIAKNLVPESIPQISTDKKWIFVETDHGLELYSDNFQLIKSWDIKGAEIIWRPDSPGIFLINNKKIYYLSIPYGEPLLIEDCAPNYCFSDFVWLP